jgi:hypothetical protein
MSGGLLAHALLRETGHQVTVEEAGRLQRLHAGAYRVYQDPADMLRHLDEVGVRVAG